MYSKEILAGLMSWAVQLSSYSPPAQPPHVSYVPAQVLVEQACAGRHCGALAWYDNQGHILIDERYRQQDSPFLRGLLVHEMMHYLQDLSGRFHGDGCSDYRAREREAYAIQREFMARAMGRVAFIRMQFWNC